MKPIIIKEFYEVFWDDVKIPLLASINDAFIKEELSTSQKQAVLKLIEKKKISKRFIKTWRPVSSLNADLKLKSILLDFVSSNQKVLIKNSYISESRRLIYHVLETASILNKKGKKGLRVTVDIEKVFDSVDHSFLLAVLQKYGFRERFLKWIQILIKNQEFCVINGRVTVKFFSLDEGAHIKETQSLHSS